MPKVLPSTQHYSILKGRLFWRGENDTHYRALGNAPSLEYEPSVETRDHYSDMTPVRTKDRSTLVETSATLSIELDEITASNLALALLGEAADFTQSQLTSQTQQIDLAPGAVIDTGHTNISNVDVVGYTENVDFVVYPEPGVVVFTEAASSGTGVDLTFDAGAVDASANRSLVRILQDAEKRGGIMYFGTNSTGTRLKATFPRVLLRPSGGVGFVSDEYATLSITADVEADDTNPSAPYGIIVELN